MKRPFGAAILLLMSLAQIQAVTIPTVPVGNAGNANDPLTGNLYGSVGYEYRIGTTEVTNAQYAAFLNAKAASDPLGLYNGGMSSHISGGIIRSGVQGNYLYTIKPNMADKPVNFVTWFDSIRFANWLNNGQGNGDTESGAYTILGGTYWPSNANSISRNAGATWFLPNENEWYKAAYYQPAQEGGDEDNYWLYATRSNSTPTVAIANDVGDITNPGPNVVNYDQAPEPTSLADIVTTVGTAGPLSDSFYGTSDQSGNVWEWNEALFTGQWRGMRGGSSTDSIGYLPSTRRYIWWSPTFDNFAVGFRVATVPEPSTYALAAIGVVGLLALRRRK